MTTSSRWLVRAIYVMASAAAIFSVLQYPGDKFIFSFFSLVIFAIGGLAIRLPKHYAHFFLSAAWFLGFWVKYLFHLATAAEYNELHGSFDGSNASWDAVFLVVGVGGAGYLIGRFISLPVVGPATSILLARTIAVPSWWPLHRDRIWLMAALLVFVILATNQELGLLVRGYVALVILPWPFGGLFAWMTDIGTALLLTLFLAWDRRAGFGVERGFVALCIEGALFSVSTLSRGLYFFHTLPPLVTEGAEAARGPRRRPLAILLAIWLVVGVAIPPAATYVRLFGQNAIPVTQAELKATESPDYRRPPSTNPTISVLWVQFVIMTRLLLVDRWTGLEGVMATVAYPEKSVALLGKAVSQRRSYGTVDVYTGRISGSTFTEENAKTYHFATLAGPIALLYFSGSLAVVFFGMALISVLISAIELTWRWLVRDRALVAMAGFYLALVVMQLSGSLIQSATGIATVSFAFIAIWFFGRGNKDYSTQPRAQSDRESQRRDGARADSADYGIIRRNIRT